MLVDILKNRLFIGALAIFVFCVGGSLLYMQHFEGQGMKEVPETEERVQQGNEKQNEQPTAEAPVVGEPQQDGHSQADGTFQAEPHEILPTESEAGLIPPVPPETAVSEAKRDEAPTKQAPYHPHDELSPEEHQRVHAELKQYGSKLDDLIRRYEKNLADLQAGRITPEESLKFLERANPERDSVIANIKRLQGE